jgi:hypothetical protein
VVSNRPSDHYESKDGARGFFQGYLTAEDADTAGGADDTPTKRTKPLRKALNSDTSRQPKGKHRK